MWNKNKEWTEWEEDKKKKKKKKTVKGKNEKLKLKKGVPIFIYTKFGNGYAGFGGSMKYFGIGNQLGILFESVVLADG